MHDARTRVLSQSCALATQTSRSSQTTRSSTRTRHPSIRLSKRRATIGCTYDSKQRRARTGWAQLPRAHFRSPRLVHERWSGQWPTRSQRILRASGRFGLKTTRKTQPWDHVVYFNWVINTRVTKRYVPCGRQGTQRPRAALIRWRPCTRHSAASLMSFDHSGTRRLQC